MLRKKPFYVKINLFFIFLWQNLRHVIMVVPLSADDEELLSHELMAAASLQRGGAAGLSGPPPRVKLLRSTSIASWCPPIPNDEKNVNQRYC